MKHRKTHIAILAIIVLFLMVVGVTDSLAKKVGNHYYNNKTVRSKATPDKVVSVDVTQNTITVREGKEANTYTLDKLTTITVNGKKATLAGVKRGMEIDVTMAGGEKVTKIDVTGSGEESDKPKKK